MKGKVLGQSRAAKEQAAEDQGGKPQGSLRLGGQRPSGLGAKSVKSAPSPQEREPPREILCSEDLHSLWDRRKKVTY